MPPTLVLSRADLRRVVDVKALTDDLRAAFEHYDEAGGQAQRIRERVGSEVTAMVLVPGTSAAIPAYTVKVHAKNAARRPALTGVICLHARDSGDLLALLDSGWLTAVRTGAGSALGADLLARPGPVRVGIVGAGAHQARQSGNSTARNARWHDAASESPSMRSATKNLLSGLTPPRRFVGGSR